MTNFETEQLVPDASREAIDVMDEVAPMRIFQLFQQYTKENHYIMLQEQRQAKIKFPNPPSAMNIAVRYYVPFEETEYGAPDAYSVTLYCGGGLIASAYTTKAIGIRVVAQMDTAVSDGRLGPLPLTVIDQDCRGFNNFLASEFLATGTARRPTDLSARIEYGLQLGFEGRRDYLKSIID